MRKLSPERDWELDYYDSVPDQEPPAAPPAWFFDLSQEEDWRLMEEWADEIDFLYGEAISRHSSYRCDLRSHVLRGCGVVWIPRAMSRSALVGQFAGRCFVVSHFAPAGVKEGVKMLETALASNTPFVFCVPPRLARPLERLGYKFITTIPQWFDGEVVVKLVMVNHAVTDDDLIELAKLAQSY